MEGSGIKIAERKKALTMNGAVEGIYKRGTNTSINLMKVQRSNFIGVQGFRGRAIIPPYL